MNKSISFIIPCYNEEKNISFTVNEILSLNLNHEQFEIIIVDDGSTDNSDAYCKKLLAQSNSIKYFKNDINLGFCRTYLKGVSMACKEYCVYIPGDNDLKSAEISKILKSLNDCDLIITYPENLNERKLSRRIISKLYTYLVNLITGNNFKYYNGFNVFKVSSIKDFEPKTFSFAFQVDLLIHATNKKVNFKTVPISCNFNDQKTSAFKIRNIIEVLSFLLKLSLNRFKSV